MTLMPAVGRAAVKVSTPNSGYSYHWPRMDICSHDAVDAPIVLEDDESDTELDAATSDDDDDWTLGATPPPDTNDPHISIPAVPAKSVVICQAQGSATDSASDGQSLSNWSVKLKRGQHCASRGLLCISNSEIMMWSAQDTPHTGASCRWPYSRYFC